jgi:hypothetical protein
MPELDTIRGLAISGVVIYRGLRFARDISIYPSPERQFLSIATVYFLTNHTSTDGYLPNPQ